MARCCHRWTVARCRQWTAAEVDGGGGRVANALDVLDVRTANGGLQAVGVKCAVTVTVILGCV